MVSRTGLDWRLYFVGFLYTSRVIGPFGTEGTEQRQHALQNCKNEA